MQDPRDLGPSIVVGRRQQAPQGSPPPRATRLAMEEMAGYRTRAPKGVFIYENHEAANADRDRWLVEAMVLARRNA